MLACIDVDYDERPGQPTRAWAACVVFSDWSAAQPSAEYVQLVEDVAPYVPGQFYARELPCVLAVLEHVREPLELLIVDGYVLLDHDKLGLGGHLYAALDERLPIVGVAKHEFHANAAAIEVLRGTSKRPLFVTAIGVDARAAANDVSRMHGEHRLPTMLKHVDQLCRRR